MPSNNHNPATNRFSTTAASEREVQRRRAQGRTALQVAQADANDRMRARVADVARSTTNSVNWNMDPYAVAQANMGIAELERRGWGHLVAEPLPTVMDRCSEENLMRKHMLTAEARCDAVQMAKYGHEIRAQMRRDLARQIANEIIDSPNVRITEHNGLDRFETVMRLEVVVMAPTTFMDALVLLKKQCAEKLQGMLDLVRH